MIQEILNRYESFSDSKIIKIHIDNCNDLNMNVEVYLRSMNILNDYEFEIVKLIFINVKKIRLLENDTSTNLIVNSALLLKQKEFVILDFFPDIYSDRLEVNELSDFIIKCEKIIYEVIN